jgi:hypothetical protein
MKPVAATQAAAPRKLQSHGILQKLDVMILAFAATGVNLRNVAGKIYKRLKSKFLVYYIWLFT